MSAVCLFATALTASHLEAAEVEAYSGAPFGVGRVTFGVSSDGPVVPLEDERFTVEAADGRVLYPVIMEQPTRRLLRRLLEIESPRSVTIYFLFRGDEPFKLKAFSPSEQTVSVTPRANPQGHRALLDQWWREYGNRWKDLRQDPQFPPVAENYLAANMARRLGFTLPEPSSGLFAAFAPKKTVWDELLITEAHQLTLDQSLLSDNQQDDKTPQPLPPPMPWYELAAAEDFSGAAVEPIAAHVPAEAFYLRFGNFTNYLWFRNLSRKWQGDLGNMIMRRGIERASTKRIEQQLSLKESVLGQFLGPQVISDVAIIGLDPYLDQGAAIGILFQAKNTPLLTQDLIRQRRAALTKFPDATETTVRIAERDVSLIATPSGEVRSYYIADGDFHLVTTSKRLAQRFILAGQGEQPLAASVGFLGVRQRLAMDRPDAVFAYVSPEFFRELTSPAIWIESQRRARAAREAKVLTLARLQATAEAVAATTRNELIAAGLLPTGFGARADGGELAESEKGFADSVHGTPGLFLPVSEMEVAAVTAEEAAAYRDFSNRFRQEVGQTPPIGIAVSRVPLPDGDGESLSIDVVATPLKDVKLGKIPDSLGDPSDQRVAPVEGDIIHAEFVLDSPLPLGAAAEPHHLFFGIRDFRSPLVVEHGRLAPGAPTAELIRMYVGTWPKPGGLFKLFFGEPTAQGPEPVQGLQDTWQARQDDFLLISFKPDVVKQVLPQLRMTPAAEPGQVWIDVAELAGSELSRTVSALGYMRSRDASVAACRLMNTLANQLHVPREECREVAEQLMDGKFVCPLGGEYQLVEVAGGAPMWTSTAITPQNRFLLTAPPENFELPLLSWFRGLRAEARLEDDEIIGHIEIDTAKSAMP
ncbi:MAG: hypothetical protein H0T51_07690 [Pirellulales bacterium]|nr:hypothetical protein [Pirellulales bacterium]